MPALFCRLSEEHGTCKDLVNLPDSHGLYANHDEDILVIFEAADSFVNHPAKCSQFHTSTLHNAMRSMLIDLYDLSFHYGKTSQHIFLAFMSVSPQVVRVRLGQSKRCL